MRADQQRIASPEEIRRCVENLESWYEEQLVARLLDPDYYAKRGVRIRYVARIPRP